MAFRESPNPPLAVGSASPGLVRYHRSRAVGSTCECTIDSLPLWKWYALQFRVTTPGGRLVASRPPLPGEETKLKTLQVAPPTGPVWVDRYQPLLILIGLKFPRLEQEGLAVKHVR